MKVGDTVRIRPEYKYTVKGFPPHDTAVIRVKLSDIPGGLVLDRPLHGIHYWNEQELEIVEQNS